MPHLLRFGFDARLAGSRHAGIGRYSEELLQCLLEQDTVKGKFIRWVVWVFADHDMPWLEKLGKEGRIELRKTSIRHYTLSEQTLWLRELHSAQLDLLYVPHFNVPALYSRPYVLTLHDLLWHTQKDVRATTLSPWMYRLKRGAYRFVSETAVKRARAVIVPTKVVADQVASLANRTEGVHVIPEGVAGPYVRVQGVGTPNRKHPFCVYTGSLYPHKNFRVILQALQLDPSMQLVVASSRNIFWREARALAKELKVEKQLDWRGFVPDKELAALYQKAVALIQPSTAEGFGLTGLEALATGTAVIASDIPVFREVYGDDVRYFNPHNSTQLVETWKCLQERPPSSDVRVAWQKRARSFKWDVMSQKVWDVLSHTL